MEQPFALLTSELRQGLEVYWRTAGKTLSGSGVVLSESKEDYFALEKNFFSALFLYSYFRANIPGYRRIFYVAVNQCLRGMVTGCDNLLDDEYKITLDTDLPPSAKKFRSILDIMVSDRVLFEILTDFCKTNGVPSELLTMAARASLTALTRSGAQEASEEAGIEHRLPPEDVLTKVHHFKTGILFESPWAIPPILEGNPDLASTPFTKALYKIGIGCQVMDDIVDLPSDVINRRHNYVASLIEYGTDTEARRLLPGCPPQSPSEFYSRFPDLFSTAHATALHYLEEGLSSLFEQAHQLFIQPAVWFITKRIGVDRILETLRGKR